MELKQILYYTILYVSAICIQISRPFDEYEKLITWKSLSRFSTVYYTRGEYQLMANRAWSERNRIDALQQQNIIIIANGKTLNQTIVASREESRVHVQ